jgi:DNA-binding CsgD family transcriptional regulator
MGHDLEIASNTSPGSQASDQLVIRCGADLVHLVEGLYGRFLGLALLMLGACCGVAAWSAELDGGPADRGLTYLFASLGVVGSSAGLLRRRALYRWLRYSRAHQLTPAAIGAGMVLVNGPYSPSWWIALALLFVVAAVSSTRATLLAVTAVAASYLGGTILRGASLLPSGDSAELVRSAAMFGNVLGARLIIEGFARFVLRLHRLKSELSQPPAPVIVNAVIIPEAGTQSTPPSESPRRRSPTFPGSRLTARQLEVALLLRDGLRQAEIAVCLGISPRQVERLVAQARERVGVVTTSHLIALLVEGQLAPAKTPREAGAFKPVA